MVINFHDDLSIFDKQYVKGLITYYLDINDIIL